MRFTAVLCMVAVLTTTLSVATAQDKTPRVDKRQANQQQQIKEGVKSGELTKKEAVRLEAREAKIRHDEGKAKADGKVTPAERAKLNRELNRSSRRVYEQKHDAQKQK